MQVTTARHDALRRIKLFDTLTDSEVEAFILFARERRLSPGDVFFREGEPGDTLAMVLDGELSVRVRGPQGTDVEVARLAAGELVGEQACIDPAPRSATVVATAPTLVVSLDRSGLESLTRELPRVGSHLVGIIIHELTARLRGVDRRIAHELGETEPVAHTSTRVSGPNSEIPTEPPKAQSGWRRLVDRLRGTT
jgi:CRP/FNR family transcriptional regulator, cyclic AMP receptor protein